MTTWTGSCHCGGVAFEADGELDRVSSCNCSWCRRTGFLHWHVEPSAFRLLSGADLLTTWQFGTMTSKNTFCRVCGVVPFRRSRSDPHLVDVNVRCLDGVDPDTLTVDTFDGQDWESAIAARRSR
jgi:hypothetical protein